MRLVSEPRKAKSISWWVVFIGSGYDVRSKTEERMNCPIPLLERIQLSQGNGRQGRKDLRRKARGAFDHRVGMTIGYGPKY